MKKLSLMSMIKGHMWFALSIALASVAFFLLELAEIIPFSGTIITIYVIVLILFSLAMYSRGKLSKYKIFKKK